MGLLGIVIGLSLLVWLAFRGWSILLLAPLAAVIAALFAGQPLLAHWTQTFMGSTGEFLAQFFPLFLLGAVFGKLMEDSGSVSSIATFMTKALGPSRAMLAVVLAGAPPVRDRFCEYIMKVSFKDRKRQIVIEFITKGSVTFFSM